MPYTLRCQFIAKKNRAGKSNKTKFDNEVVRIRLPKESEGEIIGQVIQPLGGGLLLVRCTDGHTRQISIPGKYRKRMWVRMGDIVIIIPQYGMDPDNKGRLEHRYRKNANNILFERGLVPEEYIV